MYLKVKISRGIHRLPSDVGSTGFSWVPWGGIVHSILWSPLSSLKHIAPISASNNLLLSTFVSFCVPLRAITMIILHIHRWSRIIPYSNTNDLFTVIRNWRVVSKLEIPLALSTFKAIILGSLLCCNRIPWNGCSISNRNALLTILEIRKFKIILTTGVVSSYCVLMWCPQDPLNSLCIGHGFHPCQQNPYVIMFKSPHLLTNTLMSRLQCMNFGRRNIQTTIAKAIWQAFLESTTQVQRCSEVSSHYGTISIHLAILVLL